MLKARADHQDKPEIMADCCTRLQAHNRRLKEYVAIYDCQTVNEAMNAREEAADDDGFISMANVDFGEVSVMPVSCVN